MQIRLTKMNYAVVICIFAAMLGVTIYNLDPPTNLSLKLQEAENNLSGDEEASDESDEDEFPDDGYDLEKKKIKGVVNYFLVHADSKRKVNIGEAPESGEWEVYIDHEDDNREYIWHGQDGEMESQLCSDE